MIYAHFTLYQDGFGCDGKVVAETMEAYNDYKAYVTKELGYTIKDEFVDADFGTVVVLPEYFEY